MPITAHVIQQKAGGNHAATISRESSSAPIGTAVYDPARNQFTFVPADHNIVLTADEQASIVTLLNGLTK